MTQTEVLIGEQTIRLPHLYPGSLPASLIDDGARQLLLICCRPDDDATEVFVSDQALTIGDDQALRVVRAQRLVRVARIQRGVTYERRLQTRVGIAWLVIRHV